jgi:glycosyltransferase involved in cell wall biosynthesis
MENRPLISVVIATFNMAQYLPLAVKSVLQQTYPYLEIHVVDDGSTDNTKDIMKQFSKDSRVTYHYQPNKGQACAKNKGIEKSNGSYIAFLDADDMWMENKLEKQMPLFSKSIKNGVIYSYVSYIDEHGNFILTPKIKCYRGMISNRLLVENFVGFNTTVVKRECFNKLGVFDESLPMGIDYDLWLRISTEYEFDFVAEPTIYYRVWSGQMSKNYMKRYHYGIKIMKNFISRYPNAVDRKSIKEAWAHTYVGRGKCWANFERDKLKAIYDYLYALKYYPLYLPAWKSIIKLLCSTNRYKVLHQS